MDTQHAPGRLGGMTEKRVKPRFKEPLGRPNFIREWRKFRSYTQEQLAEMAGMSPGNLSMLEKRQQNYKAETLEKLAEALNCQPGELLMVNPLAQDSIWSLWEKAKPGDRARIIGYAEGLLRASGE